MSYFFVLTLPSGQGYGDLDLYKLLPIYFIEAQ